MSASPDRHLTEAEYLARERASETRHEYVRGEIRAMAGAKRAHNLICTNLVRHLGNQLADRDCEIYQSDMRVQVRAAGAYRYPDVVVVCGTPEFADAQSDTLLNPTLLIEVLSNESAATDRGVKLWEYRQLASLREYLLVAQHVPRIERFLRQADDTWLLGDTLGPDATITLPSLGCVLALADIYARVTFDT